MPRTRRPGPRSTEPSFANCVELRASALAQSLLFVVASHVLVQDLMTKDPLTVPPEIPFTEARRIMVERRTRHLLVTDGRRLVGIVTDRDIRLNLPSPATRLSVCEVNYLVARLRVDSVMTRPVITVDPRRDAVAAARIMLEHKIGSLPVIDAGTIGSIVTETDIFRAFHCHGADRDRRSHVKGCHRS